MNKIKKAVIAMLIVGLILCLWKFGSGIVENKRTISQSNLVITGDNVGAVLDATPSKKYIIKDLQIVYHEETNKLMPEHSFIELIPMEEEK